MTGRCGDSCESLQAHLDEYLDGELDSVDCARIAQHLERCECCREAARCDTALREVVRRSCGCQEAPRELRDKIMGRITSVRVTRVEGPGVSSVTIETSSQQWREGGAGR